MEGKKVFDLTPAMAPFMDVHMVIPLLDFIREVTLAVTYFRMTSQMNANFYLLSLSFISIFDLM